LNTGREEGDEGKKAEAESPLPMRVVVGHEALRGAMLLEQRIYAKA
jgi:hypothetical protein